MLIQVKARRCFGDIPRPISCVQAALHGAHQVPSCQMQVHLLNSVQHRCRLRSGVVECSLCSADAALYIIPTSVVSHVHVCVSFHASLIGGSLFLQEPKWSRQKINIVHAACETCKTSSFGHVQAHALCGTRFPLWFKSNHGVFVSGSSSSTNWQAQFNHNVHVTQKGASLESVT